MKTHYRIILLLLFALKFTGAFSQSTPASQPLQYSQDFSALASTSSSYPAGLQGWVIGTSGSGAYRTLAPTANAALLASSSASNGSGGVHNYAGKIGMLPTAATDVAIGLAINTTGKTNIQVNFLAMTIRNPFDGTGNTSINGLDLQYRVGAIAGTWSSVSGTGDIYQNNTVSQLTGTTPQNSQSKSFVLPAACENQSSVFLRWVMRDISGTVGVAGRPSFAIDNITICQIATPTIVINGPTTFCTGQSAIFQADTTNAGTSPVYSWKKNGTTVGTNLRSLTIPALTTGDQVSCVMTSNQGCLTTTSATSNIKTITGGGAPPSITSAVIKNVSCVGIKNGGVDLTVSGGLTPYTIMWDTLNTTGGNNFVVNVGTKFSNLLPIGIGFDFYVDGTELKELFLTKGIPYTFMISGGHPFSIQTNIVGATSAFMLTNGLNPQSTVSTGNLIYTPSNFHPSLVYYPCAAHQYMGYKLNLVNGFSTEDIMNRSAGKYAVIVTDTRGCTTNSTYTIAQGNDVVTQSPQSSGDATCFGSADGVINIKGVGGTAPYSLTGTGPTFTVIKETKNHSHPQFGTGSTFGFTIDNVQGKELTLMRGITYAFSVATPGHPFFISTSIVGGNATSEVTHGVVNSMTTSGTLFFTPDASHPNLLYYQCGFHNNMGWKINILDQQPNGNLQNCMAGNYDLTIKDFNGCTSSTSDQFTINETAANTFYYDNDLDGFGNGAESALACLAPFGFITDGSDCNDNNLNVNPGATEICNGVDDDCNGITDPGCPASINLKMFIQGFYSGGGMMDNNGAGGNLFIILTPNSSPTDVDTVTVSAMNASPPYDFIESQQGILQSNGTLHVDFSNAIIPGNSYYIRITHRNSIETWSKLPVTFTTWTNYDFTTASTQAYDDGFNVPMKLIDTSPIRWAIYNGDIDHNGGIDSQDMTMEENASNAGLFGYHDTDLTGDGGSDSLDMTVIETGANAGVFEVHP